MNSMEKKSSLDQGAGVDASASIVANNPESVLVALQTIESVKDKLSYGIEAMRKLLEDTNSVDWKTFWDVRRACLALFHDLEEPSVRTSLWKEYIELTKEARHLKVCQDEESHFVILQIDLAITSLEEDIRAFCDKGPQGISHEKDLEGISDVKSLSKHLPRYKERCSRAVWLIGFSSRIAGLRKELSEVPLRVKAKSEFFRRLFVLGNTIFPIRKSITDEVSALFAEDVGDFVSQYFTGASRESLKKSLFFLRKEIKSLQNAAKVLAVSSDVFSSTRLQLSECWNSLKGLEKEIRQEQGELKQASIKHVKEIEEELAKLVEEIEKETSATQAGKELDRIQRKMRSSALVYSDVQLLKTKIKEVQDRIRLQKEKEDRLHKEARDKNLQEQRESLQKFIDGVKDLQGGMQSCKRSIAENRQLLDGLREMLLRMKFLSKSDCLIYEKDLDDCEEALQIRYEEQLLQEADEDVHNFTAVLKLKENRRKQLKQSLDGWKKMTGGSGLNFEQAMHYSSLVYEGKEKLIKLEDEIALLRQKLAEIGNH